MSQLTLWEVARWCNGTVREEFAGNIVQDVCTDSREIKPGELFVALRGEKFDGHDFLEQAFQQGASAALSEEPCRDHPVVLVADTKRALGELARGYREKCGFFVIGITGSVGKTTTKEMIASICATTRKTTKTTQNRNNSIGVPLTILSVPEDHEVAVLEMGMNHFNEMSYLTSIARPDVAVITNIGTMHIEHLGSREGILQAKLEILEGLRKNGRTVFNGDEPLLWNLKEINRVRPLYFGIENNECDVVAMDIQEEDGGSNFRVKGMNAEFEVYIPVTGRHYIYDALAAITVGLLQGIAPVKIQRALGAYQNPGMRQRIYEEKGYTIIDDCYNAGPESMEAALNVLGNKKTEGKRIAVLGDMLELGACSQSEHYRIGRLAVSKADMVFACGSYADRVVAGAVTGGMSPKRAAYFGTHEELINTVKHYAKPGDVLLFKGSRGMRMEDALHLFLENAKER